MSKIFPGWQEIPIAAIITSAGSAAEENTGDWKTERPVRDNSKCTKCGFCWLVCPDAVLHRNDEGFYETDLFHCKGCGICAHECKKGAITMVLEER